MGRTFHFSHDINTGKPKKGYIIMNVANKCLRAGAAIFLTGMLGIVQNGYADQVFPSNVIVQDSLCVGFDCVNGEVFGFDTMRLKENNLRINFDDTSSSSAFPSNDWRITINDSSNGGANYFSIDDATANRQVFRVDAGAKSNSLYVDSSGRVGLGTSTPVLRLNITYGDTPGVRLEQNGSVGYSPQTWDVSGNEANFFIRDVTHGSKLPFRIIPGAPTSSLYINNSGNIGVGTNSPAASLDVERSDGTAQVLVKETNGAANSRTLLSLVNNGPTRLGMTNTNATSTDQTWLTRIGNSGNYC